MTRPLPSLSISVVVALVGWMAAAIPAVATAQPRQIEPRWTFHVPDTTSSGAGASSTDITNVAWAPTGKCIALATSDTVFVVDTSGTLLWTWEFQRTNRLIRPGRIAASPRCDAVAVVGDPDYKYVWIAPRRGARVFFGTEGTPWAVAFSLDGQTIAVTTGASKGYLLSRRAAMLWSGSDRELPIRWPSKSAAQTSGGVRQTDFARQDVQLLRQGPFSGSGSMYSTDGEWLLDWDGGGHGPGNGSVELWRRESPNRSPRVWFKEADRCSEAIMTPDAQRIIVSGGLDPSNDDECKFLFYVLDRDGTIVTSWPNEGLAHLLVTTAGQQVFIAQRDGGISGLDLEGTTRWTIDTPPGYARYTAIPSPDATMLLGREKHAATISLYDVK